MNLYLLENYTNEGYNTYDSCLVVAADEKSARLIKNQMNLAGVKNIHILVQVGV